MKFHNTLSRKVEEFEPLTPGHVRMYTCGPTVYDYAHIGNFRAYVFEDVLRRSLKFNGYKVTQVMNLTDVDDKTIRGARSGGVPLSEYTARFKQAFFEDLAVLRIERAERYPEATAHIPEMIALVARLLELGYAYRSDDGSIYFSISRFPRYGRLAHLDMAGLKPGARVSHDEYDKEDACDFALWKAWGEADGDVGWDSPWGRGRPGWHIECSAMSMKYLGESFDIHTGGVDNIFPHHEDEIAQSEAATGKQFVRYWLHCAHLIVDGRKMSKSLGNFYTLRDVLGRGYTGREVRWVLMSAHYRQPLNFTFAALDAARAALGRLDDFRRRLTELSAGSTSEPGAGAGWGSSLHRAFNAAISEDLDTPAATAAVFEAVREGHRLMDTGGMTARDAAGALKALAEVDRVLAAGPDQPDEPDAETLAISAMREDARKRCDWAEADALRGKLRARGWEVRDTPQGLKLTRLSADPGKAAKR